MRLLVFGKFLVVGLILMVIAEDFTVPSKDITDDELD
jgi:hypothetical protein